MCNIIKHIKWWYYILWFNFFALSQADSPRTLPHLLISQSRVHTQQRSANHIQQCDVQQRQWKTQIDQFDQQVSNSVYDLCLIELCVFTTAVCVCVCVPHVNRTQSVDDSHTDSTHTLNGKDPSHQHNWCCALLAKPNVIAQSLK